jgi:hypothetical protein
LQVIALLVEVIVVVVSEHRFACNPKLRVPGLRAIRLLKQPDCAQSNIIRNRIACNCRWASMYALESVFVNLLAFALQRLSICKTYYSFVISRSASGSSNI